MGQVNAYVDLSYVITLGDRSSEPMKISFTILSIPEIENAQLLVINQPNFNAPTNSDVARLDETFRRSGRSNSQPNWKPTYSSGDVVIVNNQEAQAGGFFSQNKIVIGNGNEAGFSTYFEMYQGGGKTLNNGVSGFGDGFTFVLSKNDNILGAMGGAMGYGGILNSIAVMFDTYDNGNQTPMCVSLGTNGIQGACTYAGDFIEVTLRVWIDYSFSSQTLELRINKENSIRPENPTTVFNNLNLDHVGDEFFPGFTSSTGGAVQNTILKKWYMTNTYLPEGIIFKS
jgi:hypothetical protein